HYFRSGDHVEVCVRLVSQSFCEKCLAATWRSIQKYSSGWLDTKSLEKFLMSERQFHHLTNSLHLFMQTAYVFVCYYRDPFLLGRRLTQYLDMGCLCNLHRATRTCSRNYQRNGASEDRKKGQVPFNKRHV